jgi:hypothetical protein
MKNLKLLSLASAMVLLSACGADQSNNAGKEHAQHDPETHAKAAVAHTPEVAPQGDFSGISEEKGHRILEKYLQVKDAQVASDGAKASAIAQEMEKIFDGSEHGETAKEILFDVEHIAETSNVDHQRAHFKTLSANMYNLAKAVKIKDGELYYQHCPMVFDNQGAYWLSAEKEIRNPYHGDKMLKCGSVKETI